MIYAQNKWHTLGGRVVHTCPLGDVPPLALRSFLAAHHGKGCWRIVTDPTASVGADSRYSAEGTRRVIECAYAFCHGYLAAQRPKEIA